jgi:hypothetical protein
VNLAVVDPAAIAEDVGEVSVVETTAVGVVTAVHAWRRSRSGCVGGRKMIVARVRV